MSRKVMYVRDPVLGSVKLSPLQEELLKTVEVQRLSFIHQLGTTFQCYPGAHGMRLSHAIGVSHLAGRIARKTLPELEGIDEQRLKRWIDLLESAGMLHDIGHMPWSHTLEPLYTELTGRNHMDLVAGLVTGEESLGIQGCGRIPTILSDHGIDPREVADLICSRFDGPPFLQQMIFGEVDADMLDYLQRDFHFTGVAFGHIEVDRIVSTMTVRDDRLVFLEKALDAVRDFLHARMQMYSSVYLHKKTRIVDQMLLRASRRSAAELGELEGFHRMTDDELLSFLVNESSDPWVREMGWRIKYRQGLFSRVFRIDAPTLTETEKRFLGSITGGGNLPEVVDDLERQVSEAAGIDPRYLIVDLPLEAVRASEERFERIDIRFVDSKGKMVGLEKIDPVFADYLGAAAPNRSLMTLSCAPEHKPAVRNACAKVFSDVALPLFTKD
ncbi:HD domain-containing protein [Candidatus Fermentibacteria bacterium]|nr:HD domain-containing protein [Candidatus Fermentibacteria bacterium]